MARAANSTAKVTQGNPIAGTTLMDAARVFPKSEKQMFEPSSGKRDHRLLCARQAGRTKIILIEVQDIP